MCVYEEIDKQMNEYDNYPALYMYVFPHELHEFEAFSIKGMMGCWTIYYLFIYLFLIFIYLFFYFIFLLSLFIYFF